MGLRAEHIPDSVVLPLYNKSTSVWELGILLKIDSTQIGDKVRSKSIRMESWLLQSKAITLLGNQEDEKGRHLLGGPIRHNKFFVWIWSVTHDLLRKG